MPSDQPNSDRIAIDQVLELERQRQQAVARGDMAALASIMDDDLIHVHATGAVQDKPTYIAYMASSARRIERDDLKVRIYGLTAVITGNNINFIETPGQPPVRVPVYATQIAVNRGGVWRFVSFHATKLPE